MSLKQLFMILKARYKIALFTLLIITLATIAASLLLPKRYTSSTAVVVDMRTADPIMGNIDSPMTPAYLPTQVDIIKSTRTAQKAVKALGLAANAAVRDKWLQATAGEGIYEIWLVELMQKGLEVKPSRDSNVITITYTSSDANFSATVANAFAQAYMDTNIELKVEPARQNASWFQGQGKTLRDNLERTQNELSNYQQRKGIVITDERLDSETEKLSDLNTQLTIIESTSADTRSKMSSSSSAENMPEVMLSPLINNLKGEVNRLESKLREASVNLGSNHPQYKSMESELASLKQQLDKETSHIGRSYATTENVSRDKAANIRSLIAAQKLKLFELKHERDEANVLLSDVSAAQKAYDAVAQRFTQTNLEGQSNQTNVSILSPAYPSLKPSSPRLFLYTLIALVIGTLLGMGIALLAEMMDRRVRVADDIEQALGIPVLGDLRKQQSNMSRWWRNLRIFRRNKKLEFSV